jgi:hypothetical protein
MRPIGGESLPSYSRLGEQFQRNLPNHPQGGQHDLPRTALQPSAILSQQVMVGILGKESYTSELDHLI